MRGHAEAFAVALLVGLILGLLFAKASILHSASADRDIVFLCHGGPQGRNPVHCADLIYFNGDWSGTALCRAKHCVPYTQIFPEANAK